VSMTGMKSGGAGPTSQVIQHCSHVHRNASSLQAPVKFAHYSSHTLQEIPFDLLIRVKGHEEGKRTGHVGQSKNIQKRRATKTFQIS
jgi:hypothetical protein